MKKVLSLITLLFVFNILYSQNQPTYNKNEVSFGLVSFNQSPKDIDVEYGVEFFENNFNFAAFSSISYKRFLNSENAIRATYYRPISKDGGQDSGAFIDSKKYKEQVFKIGYEYTFKVKTITPYVAIDAVYIKSEFLADFGGGIIPGNYIGTKKERNGIGVSPVIGVNFRIFNGFYLSLESNLNILWIDEKKEIWSSTFGPDPIGTHIYEKEKYIKTYFNPFVFLIKYKF